MYKKSIILFYCAILSAVSFESLGASAQWDDFSDRAVAIQPRQHTLSSVDVSGLELFKKALTAKNLYEGDRANLPWSKIYNGTFSDEDEIQFWLDAKDIEDIVGKYGSPLKNSEKISFNLPLHPVVITELFKVNLLSQVMTLDLSGSLLGDRSLWALGMSFYNGRLNPRTLCLEDTNISQIECLVLGMTCAKGKKNLRLTDLYLSNNKIGHDQMAFLMKRSAFLGIMIETLGNPGHRKKWLTKTVTVSDEEQKFIELYKGKGLISKDPKAFTHSVKI